VVDRDQHDLYFHTLEDLLHQFRATADGERRASLAIVIRAMVDHADDLGLTRTEIGEIRSVCCHQFLDVSRFRA
jgi:hypothetical protein